MTGLYPHTERLDLLLPLLERKPRPDLQGKVLALNPSPADVARCAQLGYAVYGRAEGPWDGDGYLHGWSPKAYAEALGQRLPMGQLCGVSLPNEPNDGDAAWMAQAVREIRSRWPMMTVLVGCWANGHDGFPVPVDHQDLDHIIYNFHGYGRPDKSELVLYQAQDLALRYRRTMAAVLAIQPNAKSMLGEFGCTLAAPDFENGGACGDDISLLDVPGFDFEAYWLSIEALMGELAKDSYVVGAFLYEFGAWPKWRSMEHLGTPIEGRWLSYAGNTPESQPGQPQPIPEEEGTMPFEFHFAIKTEADRLTALGIDVGEPLEEEQPIHDVPGGTQIAAYQTTTKGRFEYSSAANVAHFFAAEGR